MEDNDRNILYDILEPFEWPVHREIIPGEVPSSLWKFLATTAKGCVYYGVQKISKSLRTTSPPLSVCQLLARTISWKIALSSDGRLLAVLQDSHVELRCLDDEFVVAIAKCAVSSDAHPQWRKMIWNEESTCLAVVNSSGEVYVFSHNGQQLCHITSKASENNDLSQTPAGVSFVPLSDHHNSCVARLIVTSVAGLLSSYLIKSSGQYSLLHTFSFMSHYPYGVGSMLYQPLHRIIIVAAVNEAGGGVSLSKWRLLDSAPHYAVVDSGGLVKSSSSIISSLGQLLPYQLAADSDNAWVFRMELSPSGSLLATIDASGDLSLYDVPSLRLRSQWSAEEQFAALHDNGDVLSGSPAKMNKKDLPCPLDVSWWSDQALIVVNSQGDLTVSSVTSLKNLLGESSEKCSPVACLSPAHSSSFLFLECEQSTASMTTPLESITVGTNLNEPEEVSPAKRAVKHLLYSLTELERFQPPRKKPCVINRTYRLVCLKSTTPLELYRRKIDNEEYGYALQLAKTYQLDCDLVYQQQWSTSSISRATIEDYLSRVSKQQWVVSECLHRVTDDYSAMTDLLKYGLVRTSLKKITSVAIEETSPDLTEELQLQSIERFTDDQLFLVMCRIKLLSYLDRLSLMQEILGGPVATDEYFSGTDFCSFRDRDVVELAIDYAQRDNWRAVDLLFSYYGNQTLPHRLAILSNFPETAYPDDYSSLLPAVNSSGNLIPWQQKSWRGTRDWCELETCKKLLHMEQDPAGEFLYQQYPQLNKYWSAATHDIISLWYHERSREIEQLSGEVLNALSLIEIAIDYGVKNTAVIYDDLLTLKSIVFERGIDTRMCLSNLEKMSTGEKLSLLMKEVEADEFADCFQMFATPFLQRQETHLPGCSEQLLTDYLTALAKDDLVPCLSIFKTAHTEHPANPLLLDTVKFIQLILTCLYTCERNDQLSIADQIFECIPEEKDSDSTALLELHRKVDAVDNHLHVVELLQHYEIYKPVAYIKAIEDDDVEAKKLMIRVARSAARKKPPLKNSDWFKLSEQLLHMQKNAFKCLQEIVCYEVLADSLLSSGAQETVSLGGQLLAHTPYQQPVPLNATPLEDSARSRNRSVFVCRIPFSLSVALVLSAAREYFNSATSPTDHEMSLARYCLDLIEEHVDEIIVEHQLIEAMGILASHQVSVLPVQVRLCQHKLEIVREALQSSPDLFRSSDTVLKLAQLLGLKDAGGCVDNLTGELGQALILVIQAAMKRSQFHEASVLSDRLISTPFPAAWSVCSELASGDQLQDLQTRTRLLQFALTHCPTNEIKRLLQVLHTVEAESLYQQCSVLSSDTQQQQVSGGLLRQLAGVQQLVSRSAGAVQQLIRADMGETGKMSRYLNWMSSATAGLHDYWQSNAPHHSVEHVRNSSQLVQSCHPFYDHAFSTPSSPTSVGSYIVLRPVSRLERLQLNHAILRTSLLLDDCSQSGSDVSEVLVSMAQSTAANDLSLFLSCLLALPEPLLAKPLILKLEPNMLTLHVAIYYVCLQLSNLLTSNCDYSLYLLPPATVVAHVTSHMINNQSDWPEKTRELFNFLKELQSKLGDLMEGKTLQEFDLDIDVERFTQEAAYKHHVILMLARSTDGVYLSTGLRLAAKYEVSKWEVFMEHLDWLLTDSKLANQMILDHMTQLGVDDVILQKPQESVDYLLTIVFPKMDGTEHNSLLVCLSLVEKCVRSGARDVQPVGVSKQIKVLKTFKLLLPAVDFKAVMSGNDPLVVLQPHLTSENVRRIADVANKIPLSSSDHLLASHIYRTFAEKMFWDKQTDKEIDWLYRYHCCQEYLEKLPGAEYEAVIKSFTISPIALELMPIDVRTSIVRKCIKFSKSQSCKMEGIAVKLQQLLKHLKIVGDVALAQLADKAEWRPLYEELAISDSETDKIHSLVVKMFMSGLDHQLINSVLTLTSSVLPHSLRLPALLSEAMESCLSKLSDDQSRIESLEAIDNMVRSCQTSPTMSMELVLRVLSDYYQNTGHPAGARVALLELIELTSALPSSDILQYKTEAILCNQFDIKIDHSLITSCEERCSLMEQLLSQAVNMDQLRVLVKLLHSWPDPMITHVTSWGHLLVQLSLQPGGRGYALQVRASFKEFSLEADEKLYENLSGDLPTAVKVAIISREELLLRKAIADAKEHFMELSSDHDLLELLIQCRQVHHIINTPLYSALYHYLLTVDHTSHHLSLPLFAALSHCSEGETVQILELHDLACRVRGVVEHLYHHGYWLEAGALLVRSHKTHAALVTTGNAISLLHKLFKK